MKKSVAACFIICIALTGCGTFIEELVDCQISKGETYTLTFINESDYDISIRGFGVRKQLNRRHYYGSILVPTEITVETCGEFRRPTDYKLTYDVTKVKIDTSHWQSNWAEDQRELYFRNIEDEDAFNANYGMANMYDGEYSENNQNEEPANEVDQTVPEFNTIPDTKTAVESPQADYAAHVPAVAPVKRPDSAPQQPRRPLPFINDFRKGMYYVQIGSYVNVNTVYSEIAKIDNGLPVAVMKATVKINGIDKNVNRVLIGPLNYERSLTLLRQFRVNYHDAFVWYGR